MFRRLALSLVMIFLVSTQVLSCTIFCFTHQGKTYFCNNEDWLDPITEIRFNPAEEGSYAWVFFGFTNNWSQGGVNEHGLCYDWVAGGGPFGWKSDPSKKDFVGNLSEELLRKCKNVDEAIAFYKTYNEKHLDGGRTLIGDKEGNSILVHWKDGQLRITRNTGAMQTCGIGKSAVDAKLAALKGEFHVADLAQALSAASHIGAGGTKYSNIFSLSDGKITLFQNRDYSEYVEIDFQAKLKAGKTTYRIADLFDPSTDHEHIRLVQDSIDSRHQAMIKKVETGLGPAVIFEGDRGWTIDERMKHYHVPGACIAVIKDHRVVWSKGYGAKDRESGEPVDSNTLFQCASISKPVSAAGALRLVERGQLNLDEDINEVLKSWKLPSNELTGEQVVTLRHLVSHTGGLTVHGFPGYRADEDVPLLSQLLNGEAPANSSSIRVDKLRVGAFGYSGGGYCVLQQMMIDATGKPFDELMKEEVLSVLNMTHCTFNQPLPLDRSPEAATGYENGRRVIGGRHVYPEMAAAGLYATPVQLAEFWIELQKAYAGKSDRLLSQTMAKKMLTPVNNGMGLGVGIMDQDGEVYIGHGGKNEGFVCNARVHRDHGYGVVVMTNGSRSELVEEIIASVARAYDWKHHGLPTYAKLESHSDDIQSIVGRYEHQGNLVEIKDKQGQMMAFTESGQHSVFRVGQNQFATAAFEDLLHVEVGKSNSTEIVLKKPWQEQAPPENRLRRLESNEKMPSELLAAGEIEKAMQGYLDLQKRNPNVRAIQEDRLNVLGYELLGKKEIDQAISVFRINVALYPKAFNTYDSLGEAYLIKGDKKLSALNYKKSLELNPENTGAAAALRRIKE